MCSAHTFGPTAVSATLPQTHEYLLPLCVHPLQQPHPPTRAWVCSIAQQEVSCYHARAAEVHRHLAAAATSCGCLVGLASLRCEAGTQLNKTALAGAVGGVARRRLATAAYSGSTGNTIRCNCRQPGQLTGQWQPGIPTYSNSQPS